MFPGGGRIKNHAKVSAGRMQNGDLVIVVKNTQFLADARSDIIAVRPPCRQSRAAARARDVDRRDMDVGFFSRGQYDGV